MQVVTISVDTSKAVHNVDILTKSVKELDKTLSKQLNESLKSMTSLAKSTKEMARSYRDLNKSIGSIKVTNINQLARGMTTVTKNTATLKRMLGDVKHNLTGIKVSNISNLNKSMKSLSRATKNTSSSFKSFMSGLKGGFVGGGLALGIKEAADAFISLGRYVLTTADDMLLLQNRINIVSDSQTESTRIMNDLYKASIEARTGYSSMVSEYSRFAIALEGTGTSAEQITTIITNMNKAMIMSGTTASEARAVITQLSQALLKGKLDGDEFRSMMENSGVAVKLLIRATGKSKEELMSLSRAGKLSADVLIKAFTDVGDVLDGFSTMPLTIGQALTQLRSTFEHLFVDLNNSSEGVTGISEAIKELANTINDNKESILALFKGMINLATMTVEGVVKITEAILKAVELFTKLNDKFKGFLDDVQDWLVAHGMAYEAFGTSSEGAAKKTQELREELSGLNTELEDIKNWSAVEKTWHYAVFGETQEEAIISVKTKIIDVEDELKTLGNQAVNAGNEMLAFAKSMGDSIDTYAESLTKQDEKPMTAAEKYCASLKKKRSCDEIYADHLKKQHKEATRSAKKAQQDQLKLHKKYVDDAKKVTKDFWQFQIEGRPEANRRALQIMGEQEEQAAEEAKNRQEELWGQLFSSFDSDFRSWISTGLRGDFDSFGDAWDSLLNRLEGRLLDWGVNLASNWIADGVESIFTGSGDWFSGITNAVGSMFGGGSDGSSWIDSAASWVGDLFGGGSGGGGFWSGAADFVSGLFGGGSKGSGNCINICGSNGGGVASIVGKALDKGFKWFMDDTGSAWTKMADDVGDAAISIWDDVETVWTAGVRDGWEEVAYNMSEASIDVWDTVENVWTAGAEDAWAVTANEWINGGKDVAGNWIQMSDDVWDSVSYDALKSSGSWWSSMSDSASDWWSGMKNGVNEFTSGIREGVSEFTQGVKDGAAKLVGGAENLAAITDTVGAGMAAYGMYSGVKKMMHGDVLGGGVQTGISAYSMYNNPLVQQGLSYASNAVSGASTASAGAAGSEGASMGAGTAAGYVGAAAVVAAVAYGIVKNFTKDKRNPEQRAYGNLLNDMRDGREWTDMAEDTEVGHGYLVNLTEDFKTRIKGAFEDIATSVGFDYRSMAERLSHNLSEVGVTNFIEEISGLTIGVDQASVALQLATEAADGNSYSMQMLESYFLQLGLTSEQAGASTIALMEAMAENGAVTDETMASIIGLSNQEVLFNDTILNSAEGLDAYIASIKTGDSTVEDLVSTLTDYNATATQQAKITKLAEEAAHGNSSALEQMVSVFESLGMSSEGAKGATMAMIKAIDALDNTNLDLNATADLLVKVHGDAHVTGSVGGSARYSSYDYDGEANGAIHDYFGMASGGIAIKPQVFRRTMFGEAGAEAVLPLHNGKNTLKIMDDKINSLFELLAKMVTFNSTQGDCNVTVIVDGEEISSKILPHTDAFVTQKFMRNQMSQRVVF
jgi:tape measure domain-containing protein